jgi:hypothetical protein
MAENPEEQTPVESLSYFQSVPPLMPPDLSVVIGDEVATDGNMRGPGTEILRFLITWLPKFKFVEHLVLVQFLVRQFLVE